MTDDDIWSDIDIKAIKEISLILILGITAMLWIAYG